MQVWFLWIGFLLVFPLPLSLAFLIDIEFSFVDAYWWCLSIIVHWIYRLLKLGKTKGQAKLDVHKGGASFVVWALKCKNRWSHKKTNLWHAHYVDVNSTTHVLQCHKRRWMHMQALWCKRRCARNNRLVNKLSHRILKWQFINGLKHQNLNLSYKFIFAPFA